MSDAGWILRTRGMAGLSLVEVGELLRREYPNESAAWVLGDPEGAGDPEAPIERNPTLGEPGPGGSTLPSKLLIGLGACGR
jgi:hypothetical protein